MRRFGLLCANVVLGAAGGTAVGLLLRRGEVDLGAVRASFLAFGWPGLFIGVTVGCGAVLGPRPPLNFDKCALAQLLAALSSGIGGFIGSLFPETLSAADRAVLEALERRGIVAGSWIGAAVGIAIEIIHVYRMRRRAARPK